MIDPNLLLLAPIPVLAVIGIYLFKRRRLRKPTDDVIEKVSEVVIPAEDESRVTTSLKDSLSKTEESFFGRIRKALKSSNSSETLEQIEEVLYTSDLGPKTVERLLEKVRTDLSSSDLHDEEKVKSLIKNELTNILKPITENQIDKNFEDLLIKSDDGPTVLMVVGVNGAGKTTTIGKMTAQLAGQGKRVLVAAGDTFRAAAGGQLKTWTERAQAEIFWPEKATDPAAVAYDAVNKAKAQNFDYVILDTAGRLHTQSHLMDELKKVKRVMTKIIPAAPHNVWIVLDANSGQNALLQAQEYNKALELNGVVLTKMDGTAKGGVVVGVVDQLQIPVKLIGVGEKIADLRVFNYQEYLESILG